MLPNSTNGGRSSVLANVSRRGRTGAAAAIATCMGAMALALPSSGAAVTSTYYVDGSSAGGACSDARTAEQNTVATPWCSIGAAVKQAPAGSTVQVRRGTYARVVARDVSRPDYVTLEPYPGETPRINGMNLERVDHLRLEGLTLTSGVQVRNGHELQFVDNDLRFTPAGARTPSGFTLYAVRRVLVQGNHIANGRDGVNLQGSKPATTDVVIWGNHFDELGNDAVHIGTGQSRILVAANFMDDCRLRREIDPLAHSDGIQAMGPSQDVIAWGNYVAGGRGFLFMVSPRYNDKRGYGHRGTIIENNVFLGRDFAVRTSSTPGAKIVNNTVWGQSSGDTSGLDITDRVGTLNDRSTGLTVANNVAKRFRVAGRVTFVDRDHNLIQRGSTAGPNDVLGTPAFVAPEEGDFRLKPGSLGVDAADVTLAPPVDVEGRSRQGRPDIGAFETDGPFVDGVFLRLPEGVADLVNAAGVADDIRSGLENG